MVGEIGRRGEDLFQPTSLPEDGERFRAKRFDREGKTFPLFYP